MRLLLRLHVQKKVVLVLQVVRRDLVRHDRRGVPPLDLQFLIFFVTELRFSVHLDLGIRFIGELERFHLLEAEQHELAPLVVIRVRVFRYVFIVIFTVLILSKGLAIWPHLGLVGVVQHPIQLVSLLVEHSSSSRLLFVLLHVRLFLATLVSIVHLVFFALDLVRVHDLRSQLDFFRPAHVPQSSPITQAALELQFTKPIVVVGLFTVKHIVVDNPFLSIFLVIFSLLALALRSLLLRSCFFLGLPLLDDLLLCTQRQQALGHPHSTSH